nr:TPA_inf: conotoxin precursor D [Conus ebraeus]
MPRLEMMLLVLLILPLPYFNTAGGQAVPGDGQGDGLDSYLLRGDRAVQRACYTSQPGSEWGKCCLTKMCGDKCCRTIHCRCVFGDFNGQGCSC